MSAQRCDTDQETRFRSFKHVKSSVAYPLFDLASVHVTKQRRLIQRHHPGLGFTLRAARDNRTCNATGDHNLFGFNGDPGSPLAHVSSPFRAFPLAFGVINSDGGS